MPTGYLIRHGAMRHVGRFAADDSLAYRRGEVVVVRSRRGDELGEVVAETESASPASARVLRAATIDDRERAGRATQERAVRLAAIEQFFRDGQWPLEPLDAEPMLDHDTRTVLLYLGPHRLDSEALVDAIRNACGLDVVLEPAGIDAPDEAPAEDHGCGSCATGGGGCGDGGSCGTSSGGCGSCGVKNLIKSSRQTATV